MNKTDPYLGPFLEETESVPLAWRMTEKGVEPILKTDREANSPIFLQMLGRSKRKPAEGLKPLWSLVGLE